MMKTKRTGLKAIASPVNGAEGFALARSQA